MWIFIHAAKVLGLIALEKSLGIEVGFGDMDQATEFEVGKNVAVKKDKPNLRHSLLTTTVKE